MVVFPSTLLEQWKVLEICVDARCGIIMQPAKTGMTEGSCPEGDDYDRPAIIINATRLKRIHLLPGATLHELEGALRPTP